MKSAGLKKKGPTWRKTICNYLFLVLCLTPPLKDVCEQAPV
jgi:hypothetical protein